MDLESYLQICGVRGEIVDLASYLQTDDIWLLIDVMPEEHYGATYKPFWLLVLLRLSQYCTQGTAFDAEFVEEVCSLIREYARINSFEAFEPQLVAFLEEHKNLSVSSYARIYNMNSFVRVLNEFSLHATRTNYNAITEILCLICADPKNQPETDPVKNREMMEIVRACCLDSQTGT